MRPRELVPGNCYFHVNYSDPSMLFPTIQTLVYVRVEDHDDGVRRWLFEDPLCLDPTEQDGDSEAVTSLYGFSDDQLCWILDFPALVRTLGEVAADHPLHPVEGGRIAGPEAPGLSVLPEQIGRFLDSVEHAFLAITLRPTAYPSLGARTALFFFISSCVQGVSRITRP